MDDIERIERRLKLYDVRLLIAVVEAGSMHKAAERLHTSQPAISRAIADLEHSGSNAVQAAFSRRLMAAFSSNGVSRRSMSLDRA